MAARCSLHVPVALLLVALAIACPGCAIPRFEAPEASLPETSDFVFYTENSDGEPGDVYVRSCVYEHPETGQQVLLIPMVHIADAGFYDDVATLLESCDVVLEEAVHGVPNVSPFLAIAPYVMGNMRRQASLAGISHQAEVLEPTSRWRNGDVSVAELQAFGSWTSPVVQACVLPLVVVVGEITNAYNWTASLLSAVVGRGLQREFHVRAGLADDLAATDSDGLEILIPGVLHRRNDRLLAVLDETVADRAACRVGVPWGAAHLPGIAIGLVERGYLEGESQWLRLLSVRSLETDPPDRPVDAFLPYAFHYRSHEESWYASLLLRSILLESRPGRDARFELLWEVLASYRSSQVHDKTHFQLLPSLFGRPLLFEYARQGDRSRYRFLLFGQFGGL
ncbi:MAG: hypothetical protein AAF581_10770 [Planctomycetota bacterium]